MAAMEVVWKPYKFDASMLAPVKQELPVHHALLRYKQPVNMWYAHPLYSEFDDMDMQKVLPGFQGLVTPLFKLWAEFLLYNNHYKTMPQPVRFMEVGGGFGCNFVGLAMSGIPKSNSTHDIIAYLPPTMKEEERNLYLMTFKHNLALTKKPVGTVNLHYVRTYTEFIKKKIEPESKNIILVNTQGLKDNALVNLLATCWTKLMSNGVLMVICNHASTTNESYEAVKTFLYALSLHPISTLQVIEGCKSLPCPIFTIWKA